MNDCSFTRKLSKNAHFIDGKSFGNKKPTFFINTCKFYADKSKVLNKQFANIDLKNQVLSSNKIFTNRKVVTKMLITFLTLTVFVLVIITIVVMKQIQHNDEFENQNQHSIEA